MNIVTTSSSHRHHRFRQRLGPPRPATSSPTGTSRAASPRSPVSGSSAAPQRLPPPRLDIGLKGAGTSSTRHAPQHPDHHWHFARPRAPRPSHSTNHPRRATIPSTSATRLRPTGLLRRDILPVISPDHNKAREGRNRGTRRRSCRLDQALHAVARARRSAPIPLGRDGRADLIGRPARIEARGSPRRERRRARTVSVLLSLGRQAHSVAGAARGLRIPLSAVGTTSRCSSSQLRASAASAADELRRSLRAPASTGPDARPPAPSHRPTGRGCRRAPIRSSTAPAPAATFGGLRHASTGTASRLSRKARLTVH